MIDHAAIEAVITPALGTVAPSIALAVYHNGAPAFTKTWGVIDPETGAPPLDPSALFDLASLTKLFTVSALLSLLTERELSLDAPLVQFVPEFGDVSPRPIEGGQNPHTRERETAPPELAGQTVDPAAVTLRHLMTHTSGLPPWRSVYDFAPPDADLSRKERWARGLARMVAYPFIDRPDAHVHYSDIGLMLLGEVVARLHDAPLDEAIAARVTRPLGIANEITFNPRQNGVPQSRTLPTEHDTAWRNRRVWGAVHDENSDGLGGVTGHAGLFGTVGAVARFGEAWRTATVPGISEALHAAAVREHVRDGDTRRGLGWMLFTPDGPGGSHLSESAYGHTGFTGTSLWIDPPRHLTVALMTNRVYYGRLHEGILSLRRAVHDTIAQNITIG